MTADEELFLGRVNSSLLELARDGRAVRGQNRAMEGRDICLFVFCIIVFHVHNL